MPTQLLEKESVSGAPTTLDVNCILTAFFNKSPDALIFIDEERRLLGMNPAAEELTGWESAEVAGQMFCYNLLNCQNERGKRLRGALCPGVDAFTGRQSHSTAVHTITRKDGQKVKVKSDYRLIHQPIHGHRIGLVQMEPLGEAASNVKPPDGAGLLRAALAAVAFIALLVLVFAPLLERANHVWVTLGPVERVALNQPTAFQFTYLRMGAPGTAYVTAERGKPVTAIEGVCPYDGATVQWNAKKGEFVCPDDGSAFTRDGTFKSGKAGLRLRRLKAALKDGRVRAWVPKASPLPLKQESPSDAYGMPPLL